MAAASRTPREEALRRCMELPWLDMYEVWQVLGSYLVPAGASETDTSRQLRERIEATACLTCAAAHLKLPEGEAPTIAAYTKVRVELDLPLTARQIETRWEGWRFAKLALGGERAVETPAQRSIRRAATGRKHHHEEYVTGVRDWLATKPAATTKADYDEWAKRHNSNVSRLPCRLGGHVESGLNLSWKRVLSVARFEVDLPDAKVAYAAELREASGTFDLVGATGVALIYGTRRQHAHHLARTPGFPPHVAVLTGSRVWYRSDVEAHHAGKPFPKKRREGELQPRIVHSGEVCQRLGYAPATLIGVIHNHGAGAPQPAGSVSAKLYWVRKDFERWVRDVFEPWEAALPEYRRRLRTRNPHDPKDPSKGV